MPIAITDFDAPTLDEHEFNQAPQLLDTDVTLIADPGGLAGGSLRLSGSIMAGEVFGVRNQGTGAGQIGYDAATGVVTYGGVAIGTVTGAGGFLLEVQFNANASNAAVEALIENLTFYSPQDEPGTSRTVNLLLTEGDGDHNHGPASFWTSSNRGLTSTVLQWASTAIGDLDGDGDMDAVVCSTADSNGATRLRTFFNDGDGDFTEGATTYDTIFGNIALGDVDGDGDADLIAGGDGGNARIRTFRNDGGGSFTELAGSANPFEFIGPSTGLVPALADLDSDGDLDLIVTGYLRYVWMYRNDGGGTYVQLTGADNPFASVGMDWSGLSFADLDGDGDLDGLVGNPSGWTAVLRNDGGVFTVASALSNAGGNVIFVSGNRDAVPALGDLDGDGDPDLWLAGYNGSLTRYVNQASTGQWFVIPLNPEPESTAPTLAGWNSLPAWYQQEVNAAPRAIMPDAVLTDLEDDLGGGVLTLSGAIAEDIISIHHQGFGAGELGFDAATGEVSFGGVVFGIATGGGAATLTVALDGDASVAAVQALIRNLTYANASLAPTEHRTLTLRLQDRYDNVFEDTMLVGVVDQREPPVLGGVGPVSVGENTVDHELTLLFPSLTLTDFDGGQIERLTISNSGAGDFLWLLDEGSGPGQVGVLGGGALTYGGVEIGYASLTSGSLEITFFSFSGGPHFGTSIEVAEAVLARLAMTTQALGDRTLTFTVKSMDGFVVTTDATVTVAPEPDAPTLINVGGHVFTEQSMAEGPQLLWPGGGVFDVDGAVGAGSLTVSGLLADDIVTILGQGSGPGQIGFDPATGAITYEGVLIGQATGGDGATLTITFNAAATDAAISALVTRLAFDNDGAPLDLWRDLTVTLTDETGLSHAVALSIVIDRLAVAQNDAFTLSENGSLSVDLLADNGSGVDSDPDGGTLEVATVNGQLINGYMPLQLASGASIQVFGFGLFNFNPGTAYDYLRAGETATETLTYTLAGGAAATITITIQGADDPFTVTSYGNVGFLENSVNAAPALLFPSAALSARDIQYDGTVVTVGGLLAEDVVSLRNQGTGAGQVGFDPATGVVTYAGVAIGVASGGAGGAFTITFDADANATSIRAVIRNITYANTSDTPTENRTLSLELVDGEGRMPPGSTTVADIASHFGDALNGNAVAVVDFNGDGAAEILVAGAFSPTPSIYGAGWSDNQGLTPPSGLGSLVFADVGDDGMDAAIVIGLGGEVLAARLDSYMEYFGYVWSESTALTQALTGAGVGGIGSVLTAGDIDGDGDSDLVQVDAANHVTLFRNTGAPGAYAFEAVSGAADPFAGCVFGPSASLALGDFDGDLDLDLLVGDANGAISCFENIGSAAGPVFVQRTGADNPYGAVATTGAVRLITLTLPAGTPDQLLVIDDTGSRHAYLQLPTNRFVLGVTPESDGEIHGTPSADALVGDGAANAIDGGDGDDTLDGGAGDDVLEGGVGADYLRGGTGADAMSGGTGNDTYIVDDAGDTTDETGGDGTDLVWTQVSWTLGTALENLKLAAPGRAIDGTGNDGANLITGNDFANTISGLGGADTLIGGGGIDTLDGGDEDDNLDGGTQDDVLLGGAGADDLIGGAGHDRLDGGSGGDDMAGGLGNDTYIVDDLADTVTELAAGGTDHVEASVDWTLGDNLEHLTLTGSGDIAGTGNAVRNTITGNSGANTLGGGGEIDTLSGGDGDDHLQGDDGADLLSGGADGDRLEGGLGNDALDGGASDDLLEGGAGHDRLTGGSGADRFAFTDDDLTAAAVERDQIFDLSFADGDVIDLSGIDADTGLGGDQAFVWASKFTKVAGQAVLKYAASTDITTLELDVDGDGLADFRIAITGDLTGTKGNLHAGPGDTDGGWLL